LASVGGVGSTFDEVLGHQPRQDRALCRGIDPRETCQSDLR
jgi:hypothetical protein